MSTIVPRILSALFVVSTAVSAVAQDVKEEPSKKPAEVEVEVATPAYRRSASEAAPIYEMAAGPDWVQDDGSVVTLGKSKLVFYGFLRLDVQFGTGRPQHTQIPLRILSEDIPADVADGAGDKYLTIHPRLTRLGMNFDGGTIDELGNAKLTGKLESDFYNLVGGSLHNNSREFFRLRHAYLKLDWEGGYSLLAGQREDIISPLYPHPNNDLVMWGAGNPGDRRPQIRAQYAANGVKVTAGIGVTGANDGGNLDGNSFFDGEASGVPTLQGRVAYTTEGWVPGKKLTVGVWGGWQQEKLDTPLAAPSGEDTFTGTLFGIDLTIPVHEKVWVKAEFYSGTNTDDWRGGILQGVNVTPADPNFGEEIASTGGWAEIGIQATETWKVVLGTSFDDPDDGDLPAAAAPDKNSVFWIANRLRYGSLEIGADYMNWTTEYTGSGIDDGEDNRFNLFFAYHF